MNRSVWLGAALPLVLLVGWEASLRLSGLVTDSLAPPSAVVASFGSAVSEGTLFKDTGNTLAALALGLLLGAGPGMIVGIALGLVPALANVARAPVEVLRTLPSVALIPLSLIAFGFGYSMEIAIVAFATFWPTLVLSQAAVAGVDKLLLEVANVLKLGPVQRVLKIVLPAAAPRLIIAVRLAIGVALIVAVTVEIVANPQGLGYALVIAQQSLNPARMLAYLLWVGLLGWGLNWLLVRFERKVAHHGRPPGGPKS